MGVRDSWIEKRLAETAAATGAGSTWSPPKNGTRNVSQMHYARQGHVTEEMEYVARRGDRAGAGAQRSGARARDHSGEHSSQIARADGDRRGVQVQDQRTLETRRPRPTSTRN